MNAQSKTTSTCAKNLKSGDRIHTFRGDLVTVKNLSIGMSPGKITIHTTHGEASSVHPDYQVRVAGGCD